MTPFLPTGISLEHLSIILGSVRDYIGIHSVVCDDNGRVIDASLVWWNDAYADIRTKPPHQHQSMLATYFDPQNAIGFVRQSWTDGSARQIFELSEHTTDKYRTPNVLVKLEISWIRVDDYIVEIGTDLSATTQLERDLIAERIAYNDAIRDAVLHLERSRIGRDLHDSVIQNLFAISLRLQARESDPWVVDAIHEVINEIRETIFKIEPAHKPPNRVRIEKVVASFDGVWSQPIDVAIRLAKEMPDDLMDDVECVLREGLSNSARHAKATQVDVSVDVTNDNVLVTIKDNGIGPQGWRRRRAGTLSLAHRATTQGGDFSLTTAPHGGTLLTWKCPL